MSNHRIEASWDQLFEDANHNARTFLDKAVIATRDLPVGVDRTAVIVAYMTAASSSWRDCTNAVTAQRLTDAIDGLASALEVLRSEA